LYEYEVELVLLCLDVVSRTCLPDEETRSVFVSVGLLSEVEVRSVLGLSEDLRVVGGEDLGSGSFVREPDIPMVEANRWLGSGISTVVGQRVT
jgi:hypothetical protein